MERIACTERERERERERCICREAAMLVSDLWETDGATLRCDCCHILMVAIHAFLAGC